MPQLRQLENLKKFKVEFERNNGVNAIYVLNLLNYLTEDFVLDIYDLSDWTVLGTQTTLNVSDLVMAWNPKKSR